MRSRFEKFIIRAFVSACAALSAASPFSPPLARAADPIESRPYAIRAFVAVDPRARIDATGRARLVGAWRELVDRFVGRPWELTIEEGAGPLADATVETVAAEALAGPAKDADQVWLIAVEPSGGGFMLVGRCFDAETGLLGPTIRRPAPHARDLARDLFRLALEVFRPAAVVAGKAGGGASLTVQGADIEPASPLGRVAGPGTVFQPIRITTRADGSNRKVAIIPWTYLPVESIEGGAARCSIVSGLKDPLTGRVAGKSSVIARGIRPTGAPLRLRFVSDVDRQPAAGYVLTMRSWPDGPVREVGTTDRDGRISVPSATSATPSILRLIAGSVEPMSEFPALPGESAEERTIPFNTLPQTVALEAQLDSLRDSVIDLVAVRSRLEARMKYRADGNDFDGLEAAIKDFNALPGKAIFAERLAALKDDAARRQAATKTPILTKTAQAQLADVQALIDRYLDDEGVRAYADGLVAARAEAAKPKASPKKRPSPDAAAPPAEAAPSKKKLAEAPF